MRYSRRDFLKLGCVSVGALMSGGLIGCASQQSAPGSSVTSNASNAERMNTESNTEGAASTMQSNSTQSNGNAAVVFFSCTGNTEAVAEKIAQATNGSLMRIEPAEPYTPADLDYNTDCRANSEQNSDARPAIAPPIPDVAAYDTVYVGYPIWWGTAPRIVLTFLEGVDLAGKTLVPFCTSGSSPISGSLAEIAQAAPGADVLDGRRFSSSVSQQEIDSWVAGI